MTPKKREPIKSDYFYHMAGRTHSTADEFMQMADEKSLRENGHVCGHQFSIRVSMIGHSGIVGEGPESHRDADFSDDLLPVTVRAHSLREALHKAAALPLSDFLPQEDEDDQH